MKTWKYFHWAELTPNLEDTYTSIDGIFSEIFWSTRSPRKCQQFSICLKENVTMKVAVCNFILKKEEGDKSIDNVQ